METRLTELEAAKVAFTEKLAQEQANLSSLRDALSASEGCVAKATAEATALRKQLQEVRTGGNDV